MPTNDHAKCSIQYFKTKIYNSWCNKQTKMTQMWADEIIKIADLSSGFLPAKFLIDWLFLANHRGLTIKFTKHTYLSYQYIHTFRLWLNNLILMHRFGKISSCIRALAWSIGDIFRSRDQTFTQCLLQSREQVSDEVIFVYILHVHIWLLFLEAR